jgi:hypothetical protein
VSAARSECWAASRHLAVACPLRETCEATTRERDALRVEVALLRKLANGLTLELIEAERSTADDLRDGDGEG